MEAVFEAVGVTRSWGAATVLGPVDLSIEAGRTTGLIGPSGAGKSTLLRLFNGLVTPTSGDVRFRGVPLAGTDLRAVRREIGYVVQGGGLFPHLTAGENVTLVARVLGWSAQRTAARVTTLAELARFPTPALERYPAQLSGGQAQRVSLMRALMLDPAVLLLDEPLGALDPISRFELQDDLRAAFATLGKTVVLVTHDLPEAAFLCDRIVLLRDGHVEQEGAPAELLGSPASDFVRQFVRAQRATP